MHLLTIYPFSVDCIIRITICQSFFMHPENIVMGITNCSCNPNSVLLKHPTLIEKVHVSKVRSPHFQIGGDTVPKFVNGVVRNVNEVLRRERKAH